jgi:glycosyltransferase involved in cell wall biosynthesis
MEPERGIADLIEATASLRKSGVDVGLVIGGKADPAINLDHPWVHYLGNLPFEQMPAALASCDLLALPYRQGSFVDNASSCKIAEYIAMERPIVATRSPNLTQNFPEQASQLDGLLATPGDVNELARCLQSQLTERRLVSMPGGMSWREISEQVSAVLDDQ